MFGFDWPELIIIGIVALVFIGPEDLPDMFRQLGRFTAKLRSMSREFSRAMDQAAKDTGVKDVAKDLRAATSTKAMGLDAVKSAADKFEKWDPLKNAAKPTVATPARPLVPPPMPATPPTKVADEMADDLAEHDAPAVVHGPATQALYDKQAARASVLAEQAEKLRAIENGSYQPQPSILPPVAAVKKPKVAKPKAKVAEVAVPEVAATPKPRKSNKKADEA